MDLHPAVVHLPIGILTLYALLELVPPRYARWDWWQPLKTVLVVAGVLGAFAALATGDGAAELREGSRLIETHESVATLTTWAFAIAAGLSLLASFQGRLPERAQILATPFLAWLLRFLAAGVGLIGLLLTGALGGAIVHGQGTDPLVDLVLKLFGI